jgi:hypothetical protein
VPGLYDVKVVNPGGLSAVRVGAVRVMFQKPLDILVSTGYSPVFLTGDSWFTETWNQVGYWLGGEASLSVFFIKKSWGFIGIEAGATVHQMSGGTERAQVSSDYMLSGGSVIYKYRINKLIHVLAKTGAGVSVSSHSFVYSGMEGPSADFSSLYLSAGLAAQYFLPNNFYIEGGIGWTGIPSGNAFASLVRPVLKAGYKLF